MKNVTDAELFDSLVKRMMEQGAYKAAVVPVAQVELDAGFRSLCESNACGKYGKCWMCPPDIGDIETLMKTIRTFDYALVYQTVGELEDSYDIEGMEEAAKKHSSLSQRLSEMLTGEPFVRVLHLGAGGCHVCTTCVRTENHPCRYPDKAMSSLEAYGVNVSRLAAAGGMKYINGQNTVTYFGAIFCSVM